MATIQPSPANTSIAIEAASPLSTRAELELVRAAYRQRSSPGLRWKLANLLSRVADWSGLIELLAPQAEPSDAEGLLLAAAWLDLHALDGCDAAAILVERVCTGAGTATQRSAALVLRARIAALRGDWLAARRDLLQALELDPGNRAACIRLARIDFREGKAGGALALVDGLAAQGVMHPYILAVRALGQARCGQLAEARETMGTGMLAASRMVVPPPGWDDIRAFNVALAAELLAHPDLRYQRYGASPTPSWGIDAPLTTAAPLLGQLMACITSQLSVHIAALGDGDHPWLGIRPGRTTLHCSCVMTEAMDFEDWHVHPTGWLNGVYYVQVPEGISAERDAGCLAFGLPDKLAGTEAASAYGRQVLCPRSGLMVAFPSHTYHRTYAHGCEGKRIAVTFELRPG